VKLISRSTDDNKQWPAYVLGGRMRTSTIGLIVALLFTSWLYETYSPPPEPAPVTQIVPPGFVPDPEYTWVPRTNVEVPRTTYPTTTTTTTTTTTEPPTTTTTSPTDPTETTSPGDTPTSPTETPPTTTVVDPDGPNGLIPPITLPVLPGATPTPAPQSTATPPPPARSAN
jgi:hypothetical protein